MKTPLPIVKIPAPDVQTFCEKYLHTSHPIVITGLADHWPALHVWDIDYFKDHFGDISVETIPLKYGKCLLDPAVGMNLQRRQLYASLVAIKESTIESALYVTALMSIFPAEITSDYTMPPYCRDGRFLTSRLFISPEGTIVATHQDLMENIYVLVRGQKKITLFPPNSPLYPFSRLSKLPNFAQVNFENPDYDLFPLFREAQPYEVTLQEGEALYIPSRWWHHLYNFELSIGLNFWWARGLQVPLAWAVDTYSRIRKIGNRSATTYHSST